MDKMYIIVRKDLGPIYKMVQGAHALAAFSLENTQLFENWNNEYLIFLDVKDKYSLLKTTEMLSDKDIKFTIFYEPDIDEVTAIACYTSEDTFKKYQVAK